MRHLPFWALFAVTTAIYVTMLTWTLPHLHAAAGNLQPFDLRPQGYSFDEAEAVLKGLGTNGIAFYENVQHRLDAFYPALFALTAGWAIALLLPKIWGVWRWLIGALALPTALFDYLENAAVSAMLKAGAAGLTPELVASASGWTLAKSIAVTIVMSALLILLLVHLGRWVIRRLRKPASA